MMSTYMRRILKLGLLMGDMAVSATGCFALMRGFRVVAMGQERPDARSIHARRWQIHKAIRGYRRRTLPSGLRRE